MQIPQNPQFGPPRFNQIGGGTSTWMDALRRLAPMQPGFNPQNLVGNPQVGQYSNAFRNLMQNSSGMQRARAGSGFNPSSLFGGGGQPSFRPMQFSGPTMNPMQRATPPPGVTMASPEELARLRAAHIARNRIPAARNPVY